MKSLDQKELQELLIKNWMTHDAMWFYHCMREVGIDKTNIINRAAVKSMAAIEAERIKKAFDVGDIRNFDQLKDFLDQLYGVVKADFMKFTYHSPANNTFRMDMNQCFAYDGIKRIGAINDYKCGIFTRVEAWFDSLGLTYSVSPQVEGCMMNTDGACYREFTFDFA